jgi:uncharacterized membrane protein
MMHKGRLEAFSDGVIAIILTIMVLELKIPKGDGLESLLPLASVGFCYVLSFLYIAIYWNNHHHLFQAARDVRGSVLWANTHLLFWLSLVPFVTGWAGESHFAPFPTALYGLVLFLAAIAYYILTRVLLAHHGKDSLLAKALGSDLKGKASLALYGSSIPLALYWPRVAFGVYILVAVVWLIPDSRIERHIR